MSFFALKSSQKDSNACVLHIILSFCIFMQNNEKICIKRAFKKRSREAASLTAQPLEEGYYLLPGLKLIAAPLYGCAHERGGVGG